MRSSNTAVAQRPRGERHRLEQLMGMPIIIDVCDPAFDGALIEPVFRWLQYVDETFSTYRADSQISRLNRGELALVDVEPVVRSVLARCESLCEQTAGYFDAWAAAGPPGPDGRPACDPSGVVKGWAIDEAGQILERLGARNFCVNAGGDLVLRGHPEDAARWHIGIQHPRRRDRVATTLLVSDAAVATSGTYERGHHIVQPHTGGAPEGVISVTVVGPDLETADAYATAIYAMGEAGAEWALGLTEYATMVVLADEAVLSTPNLDPYRLPADRLLISA
jgi:thiamine biosynthesis lipoprotein